MQEFPFELLSNILKFTSVKDILNFNSISNHFNNFLKDDINDIIYDMNSNTDKEGRKYLKENSLYDVYYRGKSYDEYDSNRSDEKFELSKYSHILFFTEIKQKTYGPGCIIVTLNSNLKYTLYYFIQEVDTDMEYTPDYYGWDKNDINILVKSKSFEYDNINSINIPKECFVDKTFNGHNNYHKDYTRIIQAKLAIYPN